jgi:hypothetical protein
LPDCARRRPSLAVTLHAQIVIAARWFLSARVTERRDLPFHFKLHTTRPPDFHLILVHSLIQTPVARRAASTAGPQFRQARILRRLAAQRVVQRVIVQHRLPTHYAPTDKHVHRARSTANHSDCLLTRP